MCVLVESDSCSYIGKIRTKKSPPKTEKVQENRGNGDVSLRFFLARFHFVVAKIENTKIRDA